MKPLLLGALLLLSPPLPAEVTGHDWMKAVPDDTRLSALSIPGTHDSGATVEPVPGTAKCQDLSIADQLNAGVRFLDIRCRHLRDAFVIHHGAIYQNLNFEGVLESVQGFLKDHPSECVILSIKEEFTPSGNSRTFEQTFDAYVAKNPAPWFLQATLPTVGQTRGKMILLRRFSATTQPKGIAATGWTDNATFNTGLLRIQDRYQCPDADAKWPHVESLLRESTSGNPDTLYLNFSSATGSRLGLPNIPAVSDGVNRKLTDYFKAHPRGHRGVIVMDFATAERCALIYRAGP
ncbi:phosphatidylinositol-specific phospholipase C [Luteolibacter sp. LG18]|uniref:phosphatidylinositol-specific phospholipase C n=1 Tax=Luteolibacter sp. LG18 TaxID=2819286 RepID=UPI002B2C9009|nr:1-phosphatidylinositol phosphodiesterase [Luteolibacter sp. LG18]